MTEELVDVLLEIPDEVERPPAPSSPSSVGGGVVVTVAVGGASLLLCQQVLLLQTLEMGEPLSVLSLAPLPAMHQENLVSCPLGLIQFFIIQAKLKRQDKDWIRLDIC